MQVDKDTQITVAAILKSVIESGAPKEQWGPQVIHGYEVYDKVCRMVMTAKGVQK